MMKNFNLIQNISGAIAPGRGYSSAPWNNYGNPFNNSKKVLGTKSEQNGRSMIEMLGVLAIIGVLSVGGIAGYSKAMTKYRINKTIEQITLIAGNVRAFFAPQRNYIGVGCDSDSCNATDGCRGSDGGVNSYGFPTYANNGCPIIKKAKLMPDEMWDDTAKRFKNVFGYDVSMIYSGRDTSDDKRAFSIKYPIGDNLEACIELLSHDWNVAGAQAIQIGGPGYHRNLRFPVAVDKAIEVCSDAISKNQTYDARFPDMIFFFDINLSGTEWSSKTWAN